jgi:hypothetical protein
MIVWDEGFVLAGFENVEKHDALLFALCVRYPCPHWISVWIVTERHVRHNRMPGRECVRHIFLKHGDQASGDIGKDLIPVFFALFVGNQLVKEQTNFP